MSRRVDVLKLLDAAIDRANAEMDKARDAVVELVEAANFYQAAYEPEELAHLRPEASAQLSKALGMRAKRK